MGNQSRSADYSRPSPTVTDGTCSAHFGEVATLTANRYADEGGMLQIHRVDNSDNTANSGFVMVQMADGVSQSVTAAASMLN